MKVLVTGSTQGIGKALAKAFVDRGDEVIIHCSKDLEKAERICSELGAYSFVTCDLSDMSEANGLFSKTGSVDCLILNASVQYKENWLDIGEETLDKQINVNVKSTLKLIQSYYPAMKEKGFGRIVTIGSVNQYRNHPELTVYSATKCAVMSMVKNIAKQVAPFGITINNVAPGAIATPRNDSILNDPEKKKAVENAIPMGRFGQSQEIVGAVLMLCDKNSYITGTDIIIDGGISLN